MLIFKIPCDDANANYSILVDTEYRILDLITWDIALLCCLHVKT
jgi:hypothetical protein